MLSMPRMALVTARASSLVSRQSERRRFPGSCSGGRVQEILVEVFQQERHQQLG